MRMRTGLVLTCLLVVASALAANAAEGPQASAATTRDARGVWFVTGNNGSGKICSAQGVCVDGCHHDYQCPGVKICTGGQCH